LPHEKACKTIHPKTCLHMPITLNDIEGGKELLQLAAELQQKLAEVDKLRQQLQTRIDGPTEWFTKAAANQCILGKGGKPVSRNGFNKMLQRWRERGYLVDGRDIMHVPGGGTVISRRFLTGIAKADIVKNTLKKTA